MHQRLIGSLALVALGFVAMPIVVYGSIMSAFGPGSYDPDETTITIVGSIAVLLIPAVLIWVPRIEALVFAGIVLLPGFLISLPLLMIPPLGLPILAATGVWYGCAYSLYRELSKLADSGNPHARCGRPSESGSGTKRDDENPQNKDSDI